MSESQVREQSEPAGGRRGRLARARLVVPLLLVNAMAITGQVGYGLDHLASPGTAWPLRVALALLFASALESIGLYVGWHAHTALVTGATASAARLRVSSYAIAAVVAGINYAHYAASGGGPTAAAVAYGLVSLLSPWLWGLHSRRERHAALERSGLVDTAGARFSAERWRAFPIRTRSSRRWSIAHGVTDPRTAWEGYHAERDARRSARSTRVVRSGRVPAVAGPDQSEDPGPGDRQHADRSASAGPVRSGTSAGPARSAVTRSASVRRSAGAVRSPGPAVDQEGAGAVRADVADLLPLARGIAAELAEADRSLSRTALVAGIRERGHTVSTERAGVLLGVLRAELPGPDPADPSDPEIGPDRESGPALRVVANRTDRSTPAADHEEADRPTGPEQPDQSAPMSADRSDQADRDRVEHDQDQVVDDELVDLGDRTEDDQEQTAAGAAAAGGGR